MDKTSANKSPLVFFILVYALSIPLWIVDATVKVRGLPLDVPVTDLIATFTPFISQQYLFTGKKDRVV
jgi:hypothetical protein